MRDTSVLKPLSKGCPNGILPGALCGSEVNKMVEANVPLIMAVGVSTSVNTRIKGITGACLGQ